MANLPVRRRRDRTSRNEIDRFFQSFLDPLDLPVAFENSFLPSVDIEETDSHILFSLDLPGVKMEDVRIEVRDNQLMVSGERRNEQEEKQGSMYRIERFEGSFARTFSLPSSINADQIEADLENGVLRVVVPKATSEKIQQVKIGEKKAGLLDKIFNRGEKTEKKIA